MADPINLNNSSPGAFNQPTQSVENPLTPAQEVPARAQSINSQVGVAGALVSVPAGAGNAMQGTPATMGTVPEQGCCSGGTSPSSGGGGGGGQSATLYATVADLPSAVTNDGVFARVADIDGNGTRGLYLADNGNWAFITILA